MQGSDAIELIKQRIPIVDLISKFVPLKQLGGRFVAPCPFHEETKPSFSVTPNGYFYCFGCQKHGDIFTFWMEYHGVSFREALEQLAEQANVTLDEEAHTVLLEKAGQRIDLGGIAKGYAVDELRKRLRRHGVHRALLDLGGTVAALGCGLPVGIRDPFRLHGAPMGTLMLEDRIAVTSGVYERFAYMDGYRYHHVVDPRTGYPSKSGLVSVTLVGENGGALDAFATAALILGMEKSAPMLAEQGMDAVFVTEHGQVFVTRGLKRQFHLHNTTNTAGAQMSVA